MACIIFLYPSLYMYTYGHLSSRQYSRVIGGAPEYSTKWGMNMEAVVIWGLRCTLWLWSSMFGYVLWGHTSVNMEPRIGRNWRYTSRRWLRELWGALWGQIQASLGIDLAGNIECTQRCTSRQWLTLFEDTLEDQQRLNLVCLMKQVPRFTWSTWCIKIGGFLGGGESRGGRSEGVKEAETQFIWSLTIVGVLRVEYSTVWWEIKDVK